MCAHTCACTCTCTYAWYDVMVLQCEGRGGEGMGGERGDFESSMEPETWGELAIAWGSGGGGGGSGRKWPAKSSTFKSYLIWLGVVSY